MPRFDLGARRRRADFERRIEAELPALMRLALALVRQPADAEDLVHDACVKALQAQDSARFDGAAGLRAWLRQILVNTYRDRYRRERRSPVNLSPNHAASGDYENVVELVANTEQSPLRSVENRESSSAVRDAFSKLPPEVRVVSVLFLVGGFAYREIAEITGSPIGTVMSRLARGRAQLRADLADYDPRTSSPPGGGNRSENA